MEPTAGSRTRMESRRTCPTAVTSRMSQGASGIQTSGKVGCPVPASTHDQRPKPDSILGVEGFTLHSLSPATSDL